MHGVRQGAATALVVALSCTGHELHLLDLIFTEGEDRVGFNKLVMLFHVAADAIDNDVSADSFVKKGLLR